MNPQEPTDQGTPVPQPPQSVASVQVGQGPVPQAPPPPMAAATTQTTAQPIDTSSPGQAADVDVIEMEWINQAKQIIAATRDDPHKQVQQLNKLKADYMQKRYNKTIKVPES